MNKKEFIKKYGTNFNGSYGLELKDVLYINYETGGYSGGNCWDDTKPQPYTVADRDDDFTSLVDCLEEVAPQVTFIQFRKIESLVEKTEHGYTEYYGNSTDYMVEYIHLDVLWDVLEKYGYVTDEL
jgi:hypothetical protein